MLTTFRKNHRQVMDDHKMEIRSWRLSKNQGAKEALDKLENRLLSTDEKSVFFIGHYLVQSYPEKEIYINLIEEVKKLITEIKNQYD
jgi:hypothetical protein